MSNSKIEKPIKVKITTTVEFTAEEWAEYKESVLANYGDTITKHNAKEYLGQEARAGIQAHVEVQELYNVRCY